MEPLLWSVTGLDEERDRNVLRRCRLLERVFGELALDGGRLSADDRKKAELARRTGDGADAAEAMDTAPVLTSLAYGEILFEPFAELLLHKALPHWRRWRSDNGQADESGDPARWSTFVDLGSGLGKAVWVARLIEGGFTKRSVGIELLTPLHNAAVAAFDQLQQNPELSAEDIDGVDLINGDFLVEDWSEADVVFCCCVTFEKELMVQIAERAALLRPGSLFLTVGKPLPESASSSSWKLAEKVDCDFSWASCTVFIHQRC